MTETVTVITRDKLQDIIFTVFAKISYDLPFDVLYKASIEIMDSIMREHVSLLCCPLCGSTEVQRKAYCNVNGEPKFKDWADGDDDQDWCPSCEEHINIVKTLVVKLSKFA